MKRLLSWATAGAVTAVGVYALAYFLYPPDGGTFTTAAGSSAVQPVKTISSESSRAAYGDCTDWRPLTKATAAARSSACTTALAGGGLSAEETAEALLSRGAARKLLGSKALASQDYLEALKHYDNAIDPHSGDAWRHFRRGAALDGLGQTERALTDYNQAIRLDPSPALSYFQRGVLLATRKRAFEEAIGDFNKVLALEPDNVEALIRRGDAYSQLGSSGQALADLERAVELAPNDSAPYLFRGLAEARRGDFARALEDYDAALLRDPFDAEALVNRAAIRSLEGRQDLAIDDLDRALAIDGDNAIAYYNRGYSKFALRRYDEAIADYNHAISNDPGMGVAYNNRCLVRAILKRPPDEIMADCDKAFDLLPLSLDVRETRGYVLLKLGMPLQAIAEYDAALEIDPNRALALYGRGLAKRQTGQAESGERDQAAALAIDPDVADAFAAAADKPRR